MVSPGSFLLFASEPVRGMYPVYLIGLEVLEMVSPGSFVFIMTEIGRGRYSVYLIGV